MKWNSVAGDLLPSEIPFSSAFERTAFLPSDDKKHKATAAHRVVCGQQASFQFAEVLVGVGHSVAGAVQEEVPGAALPLLSDLVQVSIQGKVPPFSAAEIFHNNVITSYLESTSNAVHPGSPQNTTPILRQLFSCQPSFFAANSF